MQNTYIFIPGGESFLTVPEYRDFLSTTLVEWNLDPYAPREPQKKWKTELARRLTEAGHIVYIPNFPNQIDAKYNDWKLFFEAWIQKIEIYGKIIYIGHSLGGCFLLKYFSEKHINFPHQIHQIHLIAACISAGDFSEPNNYEYLQEMSSHIHIWHAEDDMVVPFSEAIQIAQYFPKAVLHFLESDLGYGHFHGIERLRELEDIVGQK